MTGRQKGKAETDAVAPLMEHLLALRKVLITSSGAVIGAFLLIYTLESDFLMEWIMRPIKVRGIEIIYTAVSEALVTKFKVSLMAACVAASPVIIWQVWSFVKPALYQGEKRKAQLLFWLAVFLFLAGVSFCYFGIYTLAIDFFLVQGEGLASPMLSIDKYVGFMFGFIIPFGLAFLLPVALYLTTRIGLTDARMLASKRKYVLLGIFVFAAVLTPPDVVSQVALGIPLYMLYEVSILVAHMTRRKESAISKIA